MHTHSFVVELHKAIHRLESSPGSGCPARLQISQLPLHLNGSHDGVPPMEWSRWCHQKTKVFEKQCASPLLFSDSTVWTQKLQDPQGWWRAVRMEPQVSESLALGLFYISEKSTSSVWYHWNPRSCLFQWLMLSQLICHSKCNSCSSDQLVVARWAYKVARAVLWFFKENQEPRWFSCGFKKFFLIFQFLNIYKFNFRKHCTDQYCEGPSLASLQAWVSMQVTGSPTSCFIVLCPSFNKEDTQLPAWIREQEMGKHWGEM